MYSFWEPWGLAWARRSKGGNPWKFAAKHFSQARTTSTPAPKNCAGYIFLGSCKTFPSARGLQGSSRSQSAAQPGVDRRSLHSVAAPPCRCGPPLEARWRGCTPPPARHTQLRNVTGAQKVSCLYQASFWKPWGLVWARRSKGGKPWKFAAKHFSQASPWGPL